jgi:hypothetical protein
MKKIYFLIIILFSIFTTAQIINFPDAKFKAKLLESNTSNGIARGFNIIPFDGESIKIDANNNNEIEINEVLNIGSLEVNNSELSSLDGIQFFKNLQHLNCNDNKLKALDVNNLDKLSFLYCKNNSIESLKLCLTPLSGYLKGLICSNNLLKEIILPNMADELIDLSYNLLEIIEVNTIPNTVFQVNFSNNPNLKILNLKNAEVEILYNNATISGPRFANCPNLKYVCCKETFTPKFQEILNFNGYTNCVLNTYCSFTPGGKYYTVQGKNKYDQNNNGCDDSDPIFLNLKLNISNGSNTTSLITNAFGGYSIPLQGGMHTITPVLENQIYYNVSPSTVNVNFPTQTSPFTQNFCITPNGVHPDLEVTLLPLQLARPGFDAKYKVIYKNKGNITQSGTVNLAFNDLVLDLASANPMVISQTDDNLSWDFINLLPFESREIEVNLNVNSPMETPAVNSGDILNFTSTITSSDIDEMPNDNAFTLNQTVVNSFDPNDKTCLEGNIVIPDLIGQYVHYMIRFENTGTANAQNIVVKDLIDLSKFDISTLIPTSGSHSFVTNITAGNKVEFIFENINLPFDDANNDGYIAFKIKTLPTLKTGDTFTNDASIYFDYNFPILTNKATTTIAATLNNKDFEFSNYFNLYPSPVSDVLNISTKENITIKSIDFYNNLGQLVLAIPNAQKTDKVDVSSLTSGNYFVKINTDKGTSNGKFVKK